MPDLERQEVDTTFTGYVDFQTEFLGEIMDWAVKNIFKRVWFSVEWRHCAKGGDANEKFARYRDMDYLAHIFSGVSMALKVLDYKYQRTPMNNDKLQEETLSIKRAIFCYLFHDYNKITGADRGMKEKGALFQLVDRYLSETRNELGLSNDQVYQVAISTEAGTTFNIIDDRNPRSNLIYESNFSRLADQLSSRFNKDITGNLHQVEDSIEFGRDPIIPGSSIKKISFGVTNLYACEDMLRKACKTTIEDSNGFYLWSTNRAIFYVDNGDDSTLLNRLEYTFAEIVGAILRPENLLSFNERSVINSASGIINHDRESISRYVRGNNDFRKCIWLENIEIGPHNKAQSEEYSDAVRSLTKSFSINFRSLRDKSKFSLRDGLDLYEVQEDDDLEERVRVLLVRYVQLTSSLNSDNANEVRRYLNSILNEHRDGLLKGLLGKIPRNSALLLPFAIHDKNVVWNRLLDDILTDLNKGVNLIDFRSIMLRIVSDNVDLLDLPKVPNKFNMSMINGYPGSERAIGENLFGINTQTFNNRLPTSGISNGKIDEVSKFEFALRRNLIPLSRSSDEGLMFLFFPGAIPFLDMSSYMSTLSYSPSEELGEVNELKLSIEAVSNRTRKVRLDSAFFYSIRRLKTQEDILRSTYHALNIYKRTKMLVRVAFSNSPFFGDQYEAVRLEVGNSICSAMGWEKIRCNHVEDVLSQIATFNVVTNGSVNKIDFAKSARVIIDYIQQPMSLFYHVHKLYFEKNEGKKKTGFGRQFSEKIEDIRRLAYESNKDGGRKMKNITELAKSAAKMVRPNWKMSGNDRTWMLRDSLEAIDKAKVSVTSGQDRDLSEYKVFIEGILLKTLERDKDKTWMPRDTDISDFADKLIRLLKEDFDNKIPSGSMRSYLINAFEFEYMRNGKGGEQ